MSYSFADDTAAWVTGAFGGLATLLAAGAGAYVLVLKARSASRREDYTTALDGYKSLVQDYEDQGARREHIMLNQQLVIEALQKEATECREREGILKGAINVLYNTCKQFHRALSLGGMDPGPLDPLPEFPARVPGAVGPFLARQQAQNELLLKAGDAKIAAKKEALNGGPVTKGTADACPAG